MREASRRLRKGLMRRGLRVRFEKYAFRKRLSVCAVAEDTRCVFGFVPRLEEAKLDVNSNYGVVRLLLYLSDDKETRADSHKTIGKVVLKLKEILLWCDDTPGYDRDISGMV